MRTSLVDSAHLTSGQVAAILDESLRGSDRQPALAHLAACAECRREMAELHRALHDHERKRRSMRPLLILVSGAAAALVLLAIPAGLDRARSPRAVSVPTRDGTVQPVDAAPPIDVVAPTDGAVVGATPSLSWRDSGPGASYLVTVQDTSGTVAWSSTSTDTTITVPVSAGLASGRRYFWSVDARLGNGVSTTAGIREFTVR